MEHASETVLVHGANATEHVELELIDEPVELGQSPGTGTGQLNLEPAPVRRVDGASEEPLALEGRDHLVRGLRRDERQTSQRGR